VRVGREPVPGVVRRLCEREIGSVNGLTADAVELAAAQDTAHRDCGPSPGGGRSPIIVIPSVLRPTAPGPWLLINESTGRAKDVRPPQHVALQRDTPPAVCSVSG
jgi:hypothetical protein